ncbi:MAG: ATP-binding protein [Acutalibacteraceae bacterium]
MDNIYAFAAKIMMINSSKDISELNFNDDNYLPTLSDYEANRGIYVEIYSPRDVLIYTTIDNRFVFADEETDNDKLAPRYMKIISHAENNDGSFFEIREEVFASAQYMVYGCFFGEESSLLIYYPLDVIRENARTASWVLFALSLFALLTYFIIVFAFAVAFTKPLEIINGVTKKIQSLDFSQSCPKFKIRELDELSDSINNLSFSLENALDDLKNKNRQLEHDIEKERALEKSRRSFVANASHELKTPISIIQGYAEGMKYGIGCDSTEEFCDIIIEEATKMNELIIKLMELLHYGTNYKLKSEAFNFADLINQQLSALKKVFDEKNIRVIRDYPENMECYGDPALLNIVLSNYISNAISHTENENEITVSAVETDRIYKIKVFNTGKQIPGTDIENIWQSFYRADKAHSRKEGRFGLGLSIVMTIQELHKEDCGVINKQNGVEFWFDVKKA